MVTKEFAVTAVAKLSTRFNNLDEKLIRLVSVFGSNMNLELQQRSIEFNELLRKQKLR